MTTFFSIIFDAVLNPNFATEAGATLASVATEGVAVNGVQLTVTEAAIGELFRPAFKMTF